MTGVYYIVITAVNDRVEDRIGWIRFSCMMTRMRKYKGEIVNNHYTFDRRTQNDLVFWKVLLLRLDVFHP